MAETGLLLALGCALLVNLGLLCKHRGAMRAPEVRFRRPLASVADLFASKWWSIGFAIGTVGWLLHMAAMSLAPLSLVEAVIAGGIALFAIPARHLFGIRLGWRELAGLGLSAAGLSFLALTATDPTAGSEYSVQTMAVFEGVAIVLGATLVLSGTRGAGQFRSELPLAVAAGLLIGVSNVALKSLAEVVPGDVAAIVSPWTLVAVIGGLGAFLALARSLQLGDAVEVIVISSVAANCASIAGGVLVYGDPVGSDVLGIAARSAAFAAVIAAAALIPAAPRTAAATSRGA